MDWENPNPQDSIYWMAIAEALKERWCVVKYLWGDNTILEGLEIIQSFKYNQGLTHNIFAYIIECIMQLAKLYIDPTYTDYDWMFTKESYTQMVGNGRLFPATLLSNNIFKYCPNLISVSGINNVDIEKTKIILKELKTVLNMMTQTPNGGIWGRRIGYGISEIVDQYDDWNDMKK
jgi:hypothetical protein